MPILPVGKVPAQQLLAIFDRLPRPDPRVIIGPQIGEDAAVVDLGDRCLVVAADPVTFATDRIGWYAVHVNANDVAVMGARPRWFSAVLLLPEAATTPAMVEAILGDVAATCETLDVTLCGGHTEVTAGLPRPIVVGQMIGEVSRSALVRKTRLQPGDRLVLARGAAIEGTAILAREKRDALEGYVDADLLTRAAALLFAPGISIVETAFVVTEAAEVHAMHDPTEGGIESGLAELGIAAGVGLRIDGDAIPVLPETAAICQALGLDPLRLIASGALLLGAPPAHAQRIVSALTAKGVPAAIIGEARPASEGMMMTKRGEQERALEIVERDELTKYL